ncbi:MAG TPA: hypothetical protein VKV40_09010 [Ktedonobacteraceae bacterium]|nr:hypothetical protein [Ktedonobacteraceae bacterium]
MMYNYNVAPQTRRRRRNPLPGIIVLLLLVGGVAFFAHKVQAGNVITIDAGTTLYIADCAGYVRIHPNTSSNQVELQGLGDAFVSSQRAQDSDTMIINGCNLDMTVPASVNLNITADDIEVFGVSGQMNLSANGGPIILEQDTLKGQSKLDNNGSPIFFQGSLDSAASATFSANGGNVDISLPTNAAFHLKVSGILDTVTTNIPAVASAVADPNNDAPDVTVGSSPRPTLTLELNDSPVILHEG